MQVFAHQHQHHQLHFQGVHVGAEGRTLALDPVRLFAAEAQHEFTVVAGMAEQVGRQLQGPDRVVVAGLGIVHCGQIEGRLGGRKDFQGLGLVGLPEGLLQTLHQRLLAEPVLGLAQGSLENFAGGAEVAAEAPAEGQEDRPQDPAERQGEQADQRAGPAGRDILQPVGEGQGEGAQVDRHHRAERQEVAQPAHQCAADIEESVAQDGIGEGQRHQRQRQQEDPAHALEPEAGPAEVRDHEGGEQIQHHRGGEDDHRQHGPAQPRRGAEGPDPEQGGCAADGQEVEDTLGGCGDAQEAVQQLRRRALGIQAEELGEVGAERHRQRVQPQDQGQQCEPAIEPEQGAAVAAQLEGIGEAQEEVHKQRREQCRGEGSRKGRRDQVGSRRGVHEPRSLGADQQEQQPQVVEVPAGLALRAADHHQQADRPVHQAGQQAHGLVAVEGLHQPNRQPEVLAQPPDLVDHDPALGLVVDDPLGGDQARRSGHHLVALDLQQFVTVEDAGLLGHAVGQHLLDDHLLDLDLADLHRFQLPPALVVREGVDPLVQVEGPQCEGQTQ